MHHFPSHFRRTLVVTLCAVFSHGNAVADEVQTQGTETATEEVRLPAVSVTAPAVAENQQQDSAAIGAPTLHSLRAATSDSAALLKEVPGLNLQGAGGVSSLPVVHGMADDRNRIKVDGMDLISACGNHMNPPLSYIDPINVSKATVFAGITPVSLGGDSIGAAIQVDSPDPEFANAGQGLLHKGEIGAFYRSNGEVRGGNLAATLAGESMSLTYRGSTVEAKDYKAAADFKTQSYAKDQGDPTLAGNVVGSSMYKSTNQSLTLGLRHDNHQLDVKVGVQDIPYQGYPNQRMDMTGNDSTLANLRYKGQFEWGQMEARAYQEHTRHKMQFGDDKLYWYPAGVPGTTPGMPMDTEGYNTGFALKGNVVLSDSDTLRIGTEGQQYRLDDWWSPSGTGGMSPNTFLNIHDGERDRLALFSEWESQWSSAWLTQLGIRGEQVKMNTGEVQGYNATYTAEAAAFNAAERKDTDNNLDLTTLVRFTPDSNRTIEFGYSRKTRSPNLYERYTWSTGGMAMRMINMTGDGNGYVGNLELNPEIAHTVSASLDWHSAEQDEWGVKFSPYYSYVADYIDARRCAPSDSLWGGMGGVCTTANLTATDSFVYLKYVNQSAHIYGMDISGHYPLARNTAYGSFTASGKISYVRGVNGSSDDNLYNMMPLNARVALKQQNGNWTNTVETELVDAKEKVSATRNEMKTAGYGLLHLRSSYEWKQARIDVGIENVLNRFYNNPLGGAYLGEGQTMSATGVAWGTPVPGMGRSIYAGVNLKF